MLCLRKWSIAIYAANKQNLIDFRGVKSNERMDQSLVLLPSSFCI